MVLVLGSDGALRPSQRQDLFALSYQNGVGQSGSRAAGLVIFGEGPPAAEASGRTADKSPSAAPHPDLLAAIDGAALRYAGHEGLRTAGISVTDWMQLFRANIETESAYDPKAVSHAGAIGLGQLMPETARDLSVDPNDWRQNLDGSARYLAAMLAAFGKVDLALAAYNAGPDAIRAHAGIPPFPETQSHVQRVLAVVDRLEGATP
ncbi:MULTISPECIES: lytic transglycosylase domain-containing protein [unclassified Sulfitobacter]|uniref:lytic transglycosylase domain-containing protein n=1 Tax=unclassified Sulfitobacter TaxID=196795 RepID=UPI0007C36434|nr:MULTISPECIES: lytic transglycosylase domain-containing protein [unclassified Sulfitobacter]KZY03892.1 transglycosylase [Sulfitobacter sp. HI0023]KZZ67284.1 transglycosylase [Sulfitobacter sp. HI0129]